MNLFKNIEFILQNSELLFGIFFFIFGCLLGSFFNVVILRYPLMIENSNLLDIKEWFKEKNIIIPNDLEMINNDINLSFPASHCFSCKTPLKWYHNIPVISYLYLKGKCAFCKINISLQYPIIELMSGIILLFCYLYFISQGLDLFILGSFLCLSCFVLAMIDLKTFLLPDGLTYSVLWIGLFFTTQNISLLHLNSNQAIIGALLGYFSLYSIAYVGKKIKGEDVMGQGDFKLFAALGVYIGCKGVIFTFFFAPFVGILTWLLLKIIRKDDNMLPYGPSLIIGSIIYITYGNEILSLLGIII